MKRTETMEIYGKTFPDDSELITKQTLDRHLKKQETKNLKQKGESLAWSSMYNDLYKTHIRAFIDKKILMKQGWRKKIKDY